MVAPPPNHLLGRSSALDYGEAGPHVNILMQCQAAQSRINWSVTVKYTQSYQTEPFISEHQNQQGTKSYLWLIKLSCDLASSLRDTTMTFKLKSVHTASSWLASLGSRLGYLKLDLPSVLKVLDEVGVFESSSRCVETSTEKRKGGGEMNH